MRANSTMGDLCVMGWVSPPELIFRCANSSQSLQGFAVGDAKTIAQQRMGSLLPRNATEFNLPRIGANRFCRIRGQAACSSMLRALTEKA